MKALIKKLFPASLIARLKNALAALDRHIFPLFAHHGFLSSLYFCFFSSQFRREHKAILQGRLQYARSLQQIDQSSVLLRRNTHRLEKGLIMRPRRTVFATDYIGETLACYRQCLAAPLLCREELKWAHDVLARYFAVTGDAPAINQARQQFQALEHQQPPGEQSSLPYRHDQRVTSDISTEQLHALFKQRRSVRWYQPQAVDPGLIEKAVELAALAPSACNRQPLQFHVMTDSDKASEIAAIAMGTAGFSDNIPALIAVVGDLSAYPSERDRHVIYIDGGLAAMQLMLAFETLGLSSCPINWPDIDFFERKMAKKLHLPPHLRPIMLLAVGHAAADGEIPFSQKKSHQLLIRQVC